MFHAIAGFQSSVDSVGLGARRPPGEALGEHGATRFVIPDGGERTSVREHRAQTEGSSGGMYRAQGDAVYGCRTNVSTALCCETKLYSR